MKTEYTFWGLLSEYKIEIPKIQRDYAQGREDPKIKKIVDKFLENIKDSIKKDKELNLDFVYGKVENESLVPLDGQQRLTTLFLLYWYMALKEGKLTDEVKNTLLKFTYETRVSSKDFCKNLVSESIDYDSTKDKISEIITDNKWYFLSWKLDPTVSAMLNMLDAIYDKFKDEKEQLFEKLKKITFQFLPLGEFKLTDELYIKMNARGKPLTEFENFKANFSQYLKTLEDKSKLDNEWLDIFWNFEKNRNSEIVTDNVDEQFFNFFKNITLNFYVEKNDIDKDLLDNYDLFDIYEEVYKEKEYICQIVKVLDCLTDYPDAENIFKPFVSSPVNYWERLRFYSLSRFFIKFGKNKELFKRWNRITRNLINNTLIPTPENYMNAIRSINSLSENISNIYDFVSAPSKKVKYFLAQQIEEEQLKSRLILEDPSWEDIFINIEEHEYFDGQIGFILEYSKNDKKEYDKELFRDYSSRLSELFGDEFREEHDFLFQRALLTKGDYLVKIGLNKTFCLFDKALRAKIDNWRKVFNDKDKTHYLKKILDNIKSSDIKSGLEKIIKDHQVTNWRKLIINNSLYISYCKKRQIRESDGKVYLLSRTQMNGYHKEIHSWYSFQESCNEKCFIENRRCIAISSFEYGESKFVIEISFNDMIYTLLLRENENDRNKDPDKIEEIREGLEFDENNKTKLEHDKLIEFIGKLKVLSNGGD